MANIKISELPAATTLLNADEFPLNQGGTTKKSTIGQMKNSVGGFPTGGVLMFAASGVPAGWLECDGSILPINSYTNLYEVVGQNFKADGTTFDTVTGFQIPDMRGLFVRGWDHNKGIDAGRVFGKTQQDMVGPHTHPYLVPIADGTASRFSTGRDNITNTTNNTQSNSGTETRPKNIALIYCIKT